MKSIVRRLLNLKYIILKEITVSLLVISVILFFSCKKATQGPTGSQGPAGQNGSPLKGNLAGFITFYDQYGNKVKADTSLAVSIAGTSYITKSDTLGRFIFKNIYTGEYNLYFTSVNYGRGGIVGQSFSGNGTLYCPMISVSQIPSFSITNTQAVPSGMNIVLSYTVNTAYTANRKIAIYADNNAGVSNQHFRFLTTGFITSGVTTYTLNLVQALFTSNGFTSGQTVYLKLYPAAYNAFSSSMYEDTITGQTIYNALNTSGGASASFMMP